MDGQLGRPGWAAQAEDVDEQLSSGGCYSKPHPQQRRVLQQAAHGEAHRGGCYSKRLTGVLLPSSGVLQQTGFTRLSGSRREAR